jgi:hypothetical protein
MGKQKVGWWERKMVGPSEGLWAGVWEMKKAAQSVESLVVQLVVAMVWWKAGKMVASMDWKLVEQKGEQLVGGMAGSSVEQTAEK